MYVSVSSVTVDRLCQDIRCYISILNIQRTFIKLISLNSFNYEEHANGFTTFNSFVLHSQQAQAGSLEDIQDTQKKTASILLSFSKLSCGYVPTLSFCSCLALKKTSGENNFPLLGGKKSWHNHDWPSVILSISSQLLQESLVCCWAHQIYKQRVKEDQALLGQ